MTERPSVPLVLDVGTRCAVRAFLQRLEGRYSVREGILYGSRARQTHTSDSDADLVVVLPGRPVERRTISRDLAGIAFDVLLQTGVLVDALPLWEHDLAHPGALGRTALIDAIRRDGVRMPVEA